MEMKKKTLNTQRPTSNVQCGGGFTLIELLVVIGIIAILLGLVFPVFQGVLDRAKKVQAKNDVTQIVTAVNAFYTEYGQYPCAAQAGADASDFVAADDAFQSTLIDELRSNNPTLNSRQIVFLTLPNAKDSSKPRSGVANSKFYDPWGGAYRVKIDNNYNNTLTNPYTADTGAGPGTLRTGVTAWSLGKDGVQGTDFKASDDVISWQ
jgi:prepilin-type N-terminal cleavage/methylation domain-containing protein